MSKISWINAGSEYTRMEGDISTQDKVPVGIYEVTVNLSGWHIVKTADHFTFNYKIYDLEREFIEYVKKTYASTTGNLGLLCNGVRGTGKTVTAKILANELNLPIILVKSMGDHNPGLISYLSSFNFDCIFFFDEFEKQFSEDDSCILQIMDGVYNSIYRKIFLLTTNVLSVNENLLDRPSRIRYVKLFGNLNADVVNEYLNDNLKDNSGREELISYIDTLTISTIDILKAIVEEVNIHGIDKFLEMRKIFNVNVANYKYNGDVCAIWKKNLISTGYNIDKALEEYEYYKQANQIRKNFELELQKTDNEEEITAIREKYEPKLYLTGDFDYFYGYNSEKRWDKLIPGKDKFRDETVVKIDKEHGIVITEYSSRIYFYFISNPNEQPSLYNSKNDMIPYIF